MHHPVRALAIVLGAIALATAGCGHHALDQTATATTAARPAIATAAPTITPRTADRARWVRAANRFCIRLFEAARAYVKANPSLGPSRGNIVDPPFEHDEALRNERAAIALAAIPAPAADKPAIRRAVVALHASATGHEAAATIDDARATADDDPEAVLNYDDALDSEDRALTILVRLGAESCRGSFSS
jgi:hypothetical protein